MLVQEKAKFFPVPANKKNWSGLKIFFIQMYKFLTVCHLKYTNPVS